MNSDGVGKTDVRSTFTVGTGVVTTTGLCSPAVAAGGFSAGLGSPQAIPSMRAATETPSSHNWRLTTSISPF